MFSPVLADFRDRLAEWGCDTVNNEPNPARDYIDENNFTDKWIAWDATPANAANKVLDTFRTLGLKLNFPLATRLQVSRFR